MKSSFHIALSVLSVATCVSSQTLLEAISDFPELSNFTALMTDNPGLAGALLTSNASSLTGQSTILVPDNSAFTKVSALYNISMGNLTLEELEPYLSYHLLVGQVTTENFTAPEGITIPTYLTGPTYNNRTGGEGLGSSGADGDVHNGQVVFFQAKADAGSGNGTKRFVLRQLENPTVNAQGGLGHQINLTAVDGTWDGGYFQIVDKFLSLPLNCTDSIRRWKMTAFRHSLDRTGLGAPLDITQNVTCFTPNDQAFLQAGSPNVTANITDLERLVKFHTITEPLYSNFMEDGQTYTTFSNETIRITIRDGDIFVNDAKIINKNVMTNNGLMHVIDRVMSPLEDTEEPSSTSTSTGSATSVTPTPTRSGDPLATASATESTTASSTAMAVPLALGPSSWSAAAVAIFGALLL